MIKGLTHNEFGLLHKVTKYRGKISTGFAPGEGPNKENHPVAAGFFRMLKEITRNETIGKDKIVQIKDWVLNEPIQQRLEATLKNTFPRRIEIVCLYKTVDEFWESSMSMYSRTDGLLCKSYGEGTNARLLTFGPNKERVWVDREFNGKKGCAYENCPDFKAGKCKAVGLMKCFPTIDFAPNPYRFETRSKNTIIGIGSSLDDLEVLLKAAHFVRTIEAGKELPYDGFFGSKFYLVHRKIRSGGRDVFITDIMPTPDFTEMVMEPIKRGLLQKTKMSKMIGAQGSMSLLEKTSTNLIEGPKSDDEDLELADQQEIAVQFASDAAEEWAVYSPENGETVIQESVDPGAKLSGTDALLNDIK